jgi:enoyl-[acyl-carrier protein] reductase III
VELAPHGVICNAVSPGVVETEALNFFSSKDAILAEGRRRTPAGRFVTPEEVAKLVAWLCTDDAKMIVGQTITVDGGYSLLA